MSTLRISDAPLLPDVDGTEKIPTGGRGDYAISIDQIKGHIFQDIGKELVGLGNVDNTSDLDKPVSTAQQVALDLKADKSYVDTNLDLKADKTNVYTRTETSLALSQKADLVNGVIPENQIPSSFNDVLEFTTNTLPIVGESGKIYVTTDTNKTWRWAANKYVEISGWNPNSVSKVATIPTYKTKEIGVDLVAGVADSDYFNVRSTDEDTMLVEYQNVGGVATATGKMYLSALGVQQQEKSASTIKDISGQNQQEINNLLLKAKDEYVNIFDFCKCDGADESAKALLAVNRANSQRVPLYIPPNAELLINGTTTLEPIYGIFGGGRIRKRLYGWLSGCPAILVNNPNQFVDNIRFVKSDTAWADIESVTVTNYTDRVGWIEVTKNAKNFKITNNIFRGGRFCNWIYGGTSGLVFGNDSDATEEAFIYFGTTNVYTKPAEVVGVVDGVVIANNRVRNVSNAPLGGSTGDGIKTTMRCKNIAIIGNNIQGCRGDAVDLFASGESILVSNNILANNIVKGVDIKSVAETDPDWPKDIVKQQQIIVSGNHIYGNAQYGVSVAFNTGVFNLINISNNNIYKNGYGGIAQQGDNAIITNNIVYANATTPSVQSYAAGIRIEGDNALGKSSKNIKCTGNICVNNGNATDTNNCGIVIFGGMVEDCDIHSNILINSTSAGLENAGVQNYGFYCGGGKRISLLHNTANGNITSDVGWSLDSDLIGTIRTVNLGTVSDNTEYPLGSAKKRWGVHSIEVQSKAYAANAANYFTLSLRKVNSAGTRTAISNFLTTSTESLGLYPIRKVIPTNSNEKDIVPFLLPIVTGTPTPINQLTVSLNIIEW